MCFYIGTAKKEKLFVFHIKYANSYYMRINSIDLRQLRYFVVLAEELHFGRAAKRLNMSQPPLSQQIKALEEHIGALLFQRTQRHVELTSAGQYLLHEARRILSDVSRVAEQTKQAETGITGYLRVGLNFSAPFHPFTSKLLQAFHKKYPETRVDLVLHEQANILQLADIRSVHLDVALIWLDDLHQPADIKRLDLAHDELHVVVPKGHDLAKLTKIHIKDLVGLPLIAQPRHAGTQRHEEIMKAFATIESQPNIVYEVMQMPLVMNMISAGQGVSLLPSFLSHLPIQGVVFRPLVLPKRKPPCMTYNLIGSVSNSNPAADNFFRLAESLIG